MSAIAGILRFDGLPPDPREIEALANAMASSGPDAIRFWNAGPVALAHCMLRTTSEAALDVQPIVGAGNDLALVFDGRLDNRAELIAELRGAGACVATTTPSDAQLVLGAYQAWGNSSPEHLLGDFAYAIWDDRRRALFCAVDPMRAGQLYFVKTSRFLAFASADEPLLALRGVSRQPNDELIANFLVPSFQSFDPGVSWLKDVNILLGGRRLSVSADGRHQVSTYWRFEPGDEKEFASEAEAQSEFLAVLSAAVSCRLRSTEPVALMLSGGLDSASIWATVQRLRSSHPMPRVDTYSAISDDAASCIESQCIANIAGTGGRFVSVPSFTGVVSSADLVREAWSKAHPCDNSIMLPALMALAASREGSRVMLHGAGGDITTALPQKYISHFMRQGAWRHAWAEAAHASRNNPYLRGSSPSLLFLSNALTALIPPSLRAFWHGMGTAPPAKGTLPLNDAFSKRFRLIERLAEQKAEAARRRAQPANSRQEQAEMLNGRFGPSVGLAGYSRVGRRYGIEMRDPWSDRRVAEFFMRLPMRMKIRQGWTKHIVRAAFAAELPAHVAWRAGKEHLGWKFTAHLLAQSPHVVASLASPGAKGIGEYLDVAAVRQRASRFAVRASPWSAAEVADCEFLHDAAVLNLFLYRLSGEAAD